MYRRALLLIDRNELYDLSRNRHESSTSVALEYAVGGKLLSS